MNMLNLMAFNDSHSMNVAQFEPVKLAEQPSIDYLVICKNLVLIFSYLCRSDQERTGAAFESRNV